MLTLCFHRGLCRRLMALASLRPQNALPGPAWALVAKWSAQSTPSLLSSIPRRLIQRRGHIISPIVHNQMAPIVDPSWPRMGSDMQNPFQNVPGRFFYALPDLRSSLFFGLSTNRVSSSTIPSTPSLPYSTLEGQIELLPCDESSLDHDEYLDTTQGESEPKPEEGEADSELDAKPRTDSSTRTSSPLSPTSTSSSEQERTTEKTKRSRRGRRRNRKVVDINGCVMGPRVVQLPVYVSHWGQNRTPGIVPPSTWNPGYPVVTVRGRDPWFEPQRVPGY